MNINNILKNRRIELGLTMKEVATAVGVSEATVSRWESGDIANMKRDKIAKLATTLKVSPSVVMGWEDSPTPKHKVGVSIPIVGTIVAGMPVDAYEDILGYEEISAALAKTGDFVCLRVRGDSMSPKIEASDLVIVRLQSDVDSGDVAVVKINGDETTLKKVQKSEAGITLIAYNPAVYEPHFYNNEEIENLPVVVCGKVVEMKRTF